MAEVVACPKCGAEHPENAPSGICPICLMQQGLEHEQNSAAEPHDQFRALWESGGASPDVFAFLEQHADVELTDQLAVLLIDQQYRWQRNAALVVEDYLARLPQLATDPVFELQLAVGEFQARQNGDTRPSVAEFTARFSNISDRLRIKLSELDSGEQAVSNSQLASGFVKRMSRRRNPAFAFCRSWAHPVVESPLWLARV